MMFRNVSLLTPFLLVAACGLQEPERLGGDDPQVVFVIYPDATVSAPSPDAGVMEMDAGTTTVSVDAGVMNTPDATVADAGVPPPAAPFRVRSDGKTLEAATFYLPVPANSTSVQLRGTAPGTGWTSGPGSNGVIGNYYQYLFSQSQLSAMNVGETYIVQYANGTNFATFGSDLNRVCAMTMEARAFLFCDHNAAGQVTQCAGKVAKNASGRIVAAGNIASQICP